MPFTIDPPKGANIPDGTYKAQLMNVASSEGQFGTQREWFWLVDVNGAGEELKAISSANTSPGSKAYKWLTALLGRAPVTGETIEDPTGKTVMLVIAKNQKGYPAIADVLPIVQPQQVEAGLPR